MHLLLLVLSLLITGCTSSYEIIFDESINEKITINYDGDIYKVVEDFDFEGRLKEIQIELDGLNEEAFELAKIIKTNFEELGL